MTKDQPTSLGIPVQGSHSHGSLPPAGTKNSWDNPERRHCRFPFPTQGRPRDHVIDHASSRCILVSIKLHMGRSSRCVSIGWNFHKHDTQSCIHTIRGLARMWREHPVHPLLPPWLFEARNLPYASRCGVGVIEWPSPNSGHSKFNASGATRHVKGRASNPREEDKSRLTTGGTTAARLNKCNTTQVSQPAGMERCTSRDHLHNPKKLTKANMCSV
ncbi:hypothetical protein F5B21DRAFT_305969 [Xylaria acuta]|nr:hypothetical protein F5B21DRAFT_305969 [Xylaria acuta]